jgi:glucose/arabinose dehydrogenase
MKTTFAFLLGFACAGCGCGDDSGDSGDADTDVDTDTDTDTDSGTGTDTGTGTETDTGTGADPCEGVTPVAGTPDLGLTEVAGPFVSPVGLAWPPGDDRMFVVEQPGTIQVVNAGVPSTFLDIRDDVGDGESEQGLLGLAFHPDYAENGLFYVNYTGNDNADWAPDGAARNTHVVEFRVSAGDPNVADPASAREIYMVEQPYWNHDGGNLVFGPDGLLYVGTGDGGSGGDPQDHAQDPDDPLGKMLVFDVDVGGDPVFWALGLRNPWRYSFDRLTGDLWIADVGQNNYEEVDFVAAPLPAGPVNFGWNIMEATHCFGGGGCDDTGLTYPIYEYNHGEGCSITGGYAYRGCLMPGHHGKYFFGDVCGAWVRSIDSSGGGVESWPGLNVDGNISSFGEDPQGEIYIANGPYSGDGMILKIVPR